MKRKSKHHLKSAQHKVFIVLIYLKINQELAIIYFVQTDFVSIWFELTVPLAWYICKRFFLLKMASNYQPIQLTMPDIGFYQVVGTNTRFLAFRIQTFPAALMICRYHKTVTKKSRLITFTIYLVEKIPGLQKSGGGLSQ